MTQQKKLSRRDAIKLLGAAAGATALANLPSKWSKPELVNGVMPAHAQTSALVCTQYALRAEFIATTNANFGVGGVGIDVPFNSTNAQPNTIPVEGDWYEWDCIQNTTCLFGTFNAGAMKSGAQITMRFTSISMYVDVVWSPTNTYHEISVNFDTGEIVVDGCASGCTCNNS